MECSKKLLENRSEQERLTAFENLYRQALAKPGDFLTYTLEFPKHEFLAFLVQQKGLLLHGSNHPDIHELEPHQANCKSKKFGNLQAVYATQDSILPIFFAIRDKAKMRGHTESGYSERDGKKIYGFFVEDKAVLDSYPWSEGVVYALPAETFEQGVDDNGHSIDEFVSMTAVKPVLKLAIAPNDFPHLNSVGIKRAN